MVNLCQYHHQGESKLHLVDHEVRSSLPPSSLAVLSRDPSPDLEEPEYFEIKNKDGQDEFLEDTDHDIFDDYRKQCYRPERTRDISFPSRPGQEGVDYIQLLVPF